MRRPNAPPHYGGAGDYGNGSTSGRSGYLKRENDEMIDGLRNKVAAVKSLSVNIGDEIRHHNKILRDMDNEFETSSSMLGKAMKRVKIISRAGYNKHFLYLIMFAFIVFFIIYVMYKLK